MASETLPQRKPGQTVVAAWFNLLKSALSGDQVPRNGAGVATALAGSLGASSLEFLKSFIAAGEFSAGDLKEHHSYAGGLPAGEGWMLCDGRVINQTNYDAEHGAGAWATYVGTSPLDGLYLPDFRDRYPVGAATTTSTGSAPIPTTGNASNQLNLRHNHKWYKANAAAAHGQSHDSGGSLADVTKNGNVKPGIQVEPESSYQGAQANDLYTDQGLSATEDISPDSIETQIYMRII